MLLTAIWNILSKVEPYSPDGYFVDRKTGEIKIITRAQGLHLLRSRGYLIKDDIPLPTPA